MPRLGFRFAACSREYGWTSIRGDSSGRVIPGSNRTLIQPARTWHKGKGGRKGPLVRSFGVARNLMSIGPLPPTAGAAGEAGLHSEEALNISEATFQRIRELIVHGKLAPGSRVVEADVANRLDVSRTPVRAALHRLQQ